MKQTVEKTEAVKAPILETAAQPLEKVAQNTSKAEKTRVHSATETKLFNRFLEANGDCV